MNDIGSILGWGGRIIRPFYGVCSKTDNPHRASVLTTVSWIQAVCFDLLCLHCQPSGRAQATFEKRELGTIKWPIESDQKSWSPILNRGFSHVLANRLAFFFASMFFLSAHYLSMKQVVHLWMLDNLPSIWNKLFLVRIGRRRNKERSKKRGRR